MTIDVARTRAEIVNLLSVLGWVPRDADPTDFAHPDWPNGLRFKIGTSRGEVTITPWVGSKSEGDPIRITRPHQVSEVKKDLSSRCFFAGES